MSSKYFVAIISYDGGMTHERYYNATDEGEVYDRVYLDIGYDPGEVYVEEITEEEYNEA
jgi:hypothetical protein